MEAVLLAVGMLVVGVCIGIACAAVYINRRIKPILLGDLVIDRSGSPDRPDMYLNVNVTPDEISKNHYVTFKVIKSK